MRGTTFLEAARLSGAGRIKTRELSCAAPGLRLASAAAPLIVHVSATVARVRSAS